ncbi:MAG: ligand-binding sensor domain-containing protein, partial [Bacteroidota bacterium]
MRIILFLLYFLLLSPLAQGQNYFTRNITMEDGLPSNTIRDIYKDSRGLIWIGTEAGLVKYDGSEFTTYTTRDGLLGNRIWSITEDTLGNLWLANYGNGISMFDGKQFTNYTTKDGLINNNVRIVQYSDKHKGLLIGTIFGFSFYKDSAFISFTDSTQTERNLLQVTSFLETDDSTICLLTYRDNEQYIAFNPYKESFKYLKKDHRFHALNPETTFSYITQQKDTIMGCCYYGIKIYKKDTMLFNDHVGQIFDAAEDKNENLWLASWNNYDIKLKDDKGGIYKYFNNKEEYFNDKLGIETEQCWCLHYDDTENLLWIGTLDKGIYLFPMDGISYTHAEELNADEPVIKDLFIDSKKNVWVTAGGQVIKNFNPQENLSAHQFKAAYQKHIRTKKQNYSPKVYNEYLNYFKGKLHQLNEDPEGNIWVGSDVGIFQFTPDLKHIKYLYDFRYFITNSEFFFPSSKSVAFIVFYFIRNQNIETGNIQKDLNFRKNTTYASKGKHHIIDNNLWIINDTDGISLYKNDHLQFFPYLKNHINLNFSAICSDIQNRIIVGTLTGDIHFLKYTNDSLIVERTIELEPEFHGSKVNWLITNQKNQLLAGT